MGMLFTLVLLSFKTAGEKTVQKNKLFIQVHRIQVSQIVICAK